MNESLRLQLAILSAQFMQQRLCVSNVDNQGKGGPWESGESFLRSKEDGTEVPCTPTGRDCPKMLDEAAKLEQEHSTPQPDIWFLAGEQDPNTKQAT